MSNELNESHVITLHALEEVHVRDELPNDIEMISDDDEQQAFNINEQQYEIKNKLTRNQRKNRNKKLKRYFFKVVRHVYHKFTITDIKRILINMNIHYLNFNVIGHTLFLGLKNKATRERVDNLLHDEMFTKEQ
ncbi:unnamed protein product [Rotaria sordida]|uniref:Uncharacterized protein n=1 Tax=Rotaria sordida TaxID=392033 RepID=A0A815VUF8_9BILA|nr:unnamed protein product [Rotaria sordida]